MTVSTNDFEAEAVAVLADLRRCVALVLGDLQPCVRASELSTVLNLDRSLGWKLWTLAQSGASSPSPKHVPGRNGFQSFLDAALRNGASAAHVDEARRAFGRFERLSKEHARDRASVEIMLGALTTEGRSRLELSLRRAAFRANAHFLGVQCDTLYQADVVAPDGAGMMPRVVRVRGHYGLTRMRSGVSWVLSRSTLVTPSGKTVAYRRRALSEAGVWDDDGHVGGTGTGAALVGGPAPVAAAFSSTPTPVVVRRIVDGVVFQDELEPGPVGRASAIDVVTAEIVDKTPEHADAHDAVTARISTPCELLCFDVLLHESLASNGDPRLEVFTTIHSDVPYTLGSRDLLQTMERFEALGSPDRAAPVAEVPRQAGLVDWMLGSIGERASAFRLYRLRMRFPPVPALAAATYRLRAT
ncbi:MAG: hypothetical protein KF902_00730 [Phycisphaeraceae bacterium]|nr:hypothetical protein [Phycisphaeraceae bacterium]MCW5768703.1 hypothetical protein [Phycisphaeraceae bacterium]